MAICYIHFFSVVILGELLLTKTGESYKIVTPAFTLPALIVVLKSMYRMHGYCVDRLRRKRLSPDGVNVSSEGIYGEKIKRRQSSDSVNIS